LGRSYELARTSFGVLKRDKKILLLPSMAGVIMLILLTISILNLTINIQPAKSTPKTWYVDDDGPADFNTIQEAINAANPGDTIFVYNGTYFEHVSICKSLTLVGESASTAIIDGNGTGESVVTIHASNVNVNKFTVQHSGAYGIQFFCSSNNTIFGNNIMNNPAGGLWLGTTYGESLSSDDNVISGNNITNNGMGLWLQDNSKSNVIHGNNITYNLYGIGFHSAPNNKIYHNNFVNNSYGQVYGYANTWHDGYPSGGNYWSDYNGTDLHWGSGQNETGSDGIGDTAYIIGENNVDRYPLMAPISVFDAGVWNEVAYNVDVVSNSTVSDFRFDPDKGPFLRFNVTGEDGTVGFCRVTIPEDLLWVEDGQWSVLVGGETVNYTIIPDENYTYMHFTYNHSTQTVLIRGTSVIPEFSTAIILPLFVVFTLIAVIAVRKRKVKYAKLGNSSSK